MSALCLRSYLMPKIINQRVQGPKRARNTGLVEIFHGIKINRDPRAWGSSMGVNNFSSKIDTDTILPMQIDNQAE